MAETLKNLAQIAPAAQTLTTLYAVPPGVQASVSSFVACNRGVEAMRFRLAHAVSGAPDGVAQYLYYDEWVPPNKTFIATIGLTLSAADVLRVYSNTGTASFNLYGAELT